MTNREKIEKAIYNDLEPYMKKSTLARRMVAIMQIIEPVELERNDLMEGDYMPDKELITLNKDMKEDFFGQMKGAQP